MEIICYEILYPLCMNEGQQCSLSERCKTVVSLNLNQISFRSRCQECAQRHHALERNTTERQNERCEEPACEREWRPGL